MSYGIKALHSIEFLSEATKTTSLYSTRHITSFAIRQTYLVHPPGSHPPLFYSTLMLSSSSSSSVSFDVFCCRHSHVHSKSKSEKIETHNALFHFIDAEQMCAVVLGAQELLVMSMWRKISEVILQIKASAPLLPSPLSIPFR